MELIHFAVSDPALQQPFADLDIIRVLKLACPSMDEAALSAWTLRSFTSDPDELSARYKVFADVTDLEAAIEAYHHVQSFREELDKQSRAMGELHEVMYDWRVLSVYVSLVESLQVLCEKSTGASSRMEALHTQLKEVLKDPAFATIRAVITQVQKILPFPKHLYVGINARESGDATDIGIIRDDASDEEIQALLDSKAPTASSKSLFPEMSYTRLQYGTHFEEYLLQHFEKRYHSEIAKAHKLLADVYPLRTPEFLELEDSLQYLVVGLSLYSLFTEAGYSLCTPDPSAACLRSESLMYPDLALHLQGLEGKYVVLENGSSTLITGANHSGKTSYLKTLGQSLVLAQFGFKVPASSFAFRPFQKYYTLFSTGEDSSMSVSRMGVEIQRLSVIMQSATDKDLVLINEPMTSTNPIEAVSICCDLMERFIDHGITHLVVTHLYDIYYLLKTRLTAEKDSHFTSLITLSDFSEETGMVHSYRLKESAPLGNSYARETAKSFQITLEDLLEDSEKRQEAASYCRSTQLENIYDGAQGSGKEV